MKRLSGLLAACSLIVLLTACVPPVAADVESAPPSEPAPSSTPEPTVLPRPGLAFNGDCAAIFSDDDVSSLVGAEVALSSAPTSDRVAAIEVLGGTSCSWGDVSEHPVVWLTVIPAAGLDDIIADASADQPRCYGGDKIVGAEGTCSFSTVVDGYWLSGVFYVAPGSGKRATDGIDGLAALLASRAVVVSAHATVRPDGMWGQVPECAEFAGRVDTAAALGGEPLTADQGSIGGEGGPGFYGALDAVGHRACIWSAVDGEYRFETEILPGAGWVVPQLVESGAGTAVTIDGTVAAASIDHDGNATTTYATDGVNLVSVVVPTGNVAPEQLAPLVSAIMQGAATE